VTYQSNLATWPEHFAGRLPLSEAFYSLQGEGRFAGMPAIFLRFAYCNLGCVWCDSRFTWDADKLEPVELLSPEAINERAIALLQGTRATPGTVHVVFTGGEPMLHQDRLPQLIDLLRSQGFDFFEIETNGTLTPTSAMIERISWWNCSPKPGNNGIAIIIQIVREALQTIAATDHADFKFVIRTPQDIDEVERYFIPIIGRERIILMPEGTTAASQLQAMPWLMEECAKRGFRFMPRLHVLAWGNERGR
jgi:organic radical activating enzyme